MARITDAEVSAVNDRIARARTTAEAFRIIDGLTRAMLSRVLDLNHLPDGRGEGTRNALAAEHGWSHHERDDDRPADGRGPCELGRFESHGNRPWECRGCKRRRIDHRPVVRRFVTFTATITKADGSDTNAAGEPCEPGKGRRELAPKRGFYPQRNYSPDSAESPAEWLARNLRATLGKIDGYDGSTFRAADPVWDGPGRSAWVAAHAEGFTAAEVSEAARLLDLAS